MAQSNMPSTAPSSISDASQAPSSSSPVLVDKPDPERLKQAAYWFATLVDDEVNEQEKNDWRDWCQQCPENAQAWRYIEQVSQRFQAFEQSNQQETAYSALNSAQQVTVSRRDSLRLLSGLLLIGAGSGLGWYYTPFGGKVQGMLADHHTGIGEVKPLTLADKSQLWLNTDSALNVHFSDRQRLLQLVRGEVLIDTAHEKKRPFIIQTAQGSLQALGTRFSVQQLADSSRLSVFDGAVEITCRQSGHNSIIRAGQQTAFDNIGLQQQEHASQAHQAWSQGLLLADRITLKDFILQVGRYHPHVIQVSERVAHIPVMGTFPAHDLEKILLMLQESLQVNTRQILPWWLRIEPV